MRDASNDSVHTFSSPVTSNPSPKSILIKAAIQAPSHKDDAHLNRIKSPRMSRFQSNAHAEYENADGRYQPVNWVVVENEQNGLLLVMDATSANIERNGYGTVVEFPIRGSDADPMRYLNIVEPRRMLTDMCHLHPLPLSRQIWGMWVVSIRVTIHQL
ncbi:hypothetical protein BDR26DRAFT_209419 [Obelidium mucronatum]|nr:hypothetical protein BDR26DRAFT_209419 [Obelidium mucronatum]